VNVLIIDEAQNLSVGVLEQLRLLTNLETSERKLLQIILIGQPELRTMLGRADLEQLAQRVVARFHLDALSESETAQYVAHRLAVAGRTAPLPFTRAAMRRIYKLSRGVPRRINLLCGRALLGAYAMRRTMIDSDVVQTAAGEVFDATAFQTAPANWPARFDFFPFSLFRKQKPGAAEARVKPSTKKKPPAPGALANKER
jgi:general secretion pathway protein A